MVGRGHVSSRVRRRIGPCAGPREFSWNPLEAVGCGGTGAMSALFVAATTFNPRLRALRDGSRGWPTIVLHLPGGTSGRSSPFWRCSSVRRPGGLRSARRRGQRQADIEGEKPLREMVWPAAHRHVPTRAAAIAEGAAGLDRQHEPSARPPDERGEGHGRPCLSQRAVIAPPAAAGAHRAPCGLRATPAFAPARIAPRPRSVGNPSPASKRRLAHRPLRRRERRATGRDRWARPARIGGARAMSSR